MSMYDDWWDYYEPEKGNALDNELMVRLDMLENYNTWVASGGKLISVNDMDNKYINNVMNFLMPIIKCNFTALSCYRYFYNVLEKRNG